MATLQRTLGPWRGTALMLNIVLGAGLLVLPGLAVKQAGDAAFLVWVCCALAAAPLLGVFIVLGRRYPDAGGLASIAGRAFGRPAYVAASFLFLGAIALGLPSIAITGGHYVAATLGGSPFAYALGFLALAVGANLGSAELAGRINTAIASTLVVVLVAFAILGLWTSDASPTPPTGLVPGSIDAHVLGVVSGSFAMVFFAFTGWEVGANLSEEFERPERDFPIAMGASFFLAVALYLSLAYVAQTAQLDGAYDAPFAQLFEHRFSLAGGAVVSIVAAVLIFANLSAAIWAVSRLVFSLSREHVLPQFLANTRRGTPYNAVTATVLSLAAITVASAAGLLHLDRMLGYSGQNFLLLYGAASLALVALGQTLKEKTLGAGATLLVFALSLIRGLDLIYPLALIALAVLVVRLSPTATATVGHWLAVGLLSSGWAGCR